MNKLAHQIIIIFYAFVPKKMTSQKLNANQKTVKKVVRVK